MFENQVAQVKQNELMAQQDFTKLACDYLTAMGNKCNESQQKQFINICQSFGLNPFKREIYAVKYGENFNVIVGYEVYLKRAERTGKLDGWGVSFEGQGGNMTAILTIHRKDWTHPFTYEVYLSECTSGKNLWATKPKTMLRKTAIGQGFRLCFPDELGGLPYMAEEITEHSEEEIKVEFSVVEPKQQPVQPAQPVQPEEKIVIGEPVNTSIFETF